MINSMSHDHPRAAGEYATGFQTSNASAPSDPQEFDGFVRFIDQDYREVRDDIDMIVRCSLDADGPALELGCGTGRVLLPVAVAGCPITGVDISPALLELADRKIHAIAPSGRATLHRADLRSFLLPERSFAFAFCVSNTLLHLTTQTDQLTVLRNAAAHLRPGGLLLLDLFNPDVKRLGEVAGIAELADSWDDPTTGARVVKWSVRTVYWAEQIQETLFIYEEIFPNGTTQKTLCPFSLRFLWRGELELMLAAAGFQVQSVWGDFAGSPFDESSERLVVLARKSTQT